MEMHAHSGRPIPSGTRCFAYLVSTSYCHAFESVQIHPTKGETITVLDDLKNAVKAYAADQS